MAMAWSAFAEQRLERRTSVQSSSDSDSQRACTPEPPQARTPPNAPQDESPHAQMKPPGEKQPHGTGDAPVGDDDERWTEQRTCPSQGPRARNAAGNTATRTPGADGERPPSPRPNPPHPPSSPPPGDRPSCQPRRPLEDPPPP
ncbi:hypothetical protein BRADI_1g01334v3 [Brachypodium distachyon]|uniref:Uncharacterized protein n=1 Tax=Brachypodium distachyon TaxID=15368 RepID=A0A2K2DHM0_BRADI|nr:hypothetical protein BRADI_1g01334v3 [Brachypodium distachyon]